MKVTIHQPEHMPWLGYFHKMAQADIYVFLDIVQFTKNNWQNRNKFVDRNGNVFWLTIPVITKGHTSCSIKDIKINSTQEWQRKYWGRLHDAYCKHPFYGKYCDQLKSILSRNYIYLVDINYDLTDFFRKTLRINNKTVKASELNVQGTRSELLANICSELGADTYLSGPSGKDYLDMTLFNSRSINVAFHDFEYPVYPAEHYNPYLSTLDLLMNCGDKSKTILGIVT